MGLSASIVLIAVGAVLRYAVAAPITGLRIHVVGDILVGVGIFGLVVWFILWAGSSLETRRTLGAGRGYENRQAPPTTRALPENERLEEDEEDARRAA